MKTLKYFVIIIIITFSYCAEAQEVNNLTNEDYSKILINNIKLVDIENTNANKDSLEKLFNETFKVNTSDLGYELTSFINDNVVFEFNDEDEDGNYDLVGIEIKNSSFTIKSTTVSIGDSIDMLNMFKINTDASGKQQVIFGDDYTDTSIFIEFDDVTKKITSIKYSTL